MKQLSVEGQLDAIMQHLLDSGVDVLDPRTGEHTIAAFDEKVVVQDGEFPFFTKGVASPRLAFEEMWFFLNGKTQTKELEDEGVFFWTGNTTRESLDNVGLPYLEEGELGAAYSSQWRNAGGYMKDASIKLGKSIAAKGVDQLANLLYGLKNNKYGRRHIVTLWNPYENDLGCITPCHHTSQYVVLPDGNGADVLHVKLINRSLDCLLGMKFAVMQYRMFQIVLCKMFGFKLGKLSLDLSQYHIYHNQIEYVKEHLQREEVDKELSCISIKDGVVLETLEHLLNMKWIDWDMKYEYNKQPYKTERPKMVA